MKKKLIGFVFAIFAALCGEWSEANAIQGSLVGINWNPDLNKNQVFSINPSTGASTLLNSFSFDTGYWNGEIIPGQNDQFYTRSSGETLYRFDGLTGSILETSSLDKTFQAFGYIAPVPLPASVWMLLSGLGGLGLLAKKRKGAK